METLAQLVAAAAANLQRPKPTGDRHKQNLAASSQIKCKMTNSAAANFTRTQRRGRQLTLVAAVGLCLAAACCLSARQVHGQQLESKASKSLVAEPRSGSLMDQEYGDEAGELDIMANQQQIPTAQLMSAAGHIVPENFFLSGGSIPANLYHPRHYQLAALQHHQQQQQREQQQQQQQQQAQQQDQLQAASQHLIGARQIAQMARLHGSPLIDLVASASDQHNQQADSPASLIDFNGYSLLDTVQREPAAAANSANIQPMDLLEFLGEQQQQQQHHHHNHHHHHQQLTEQQQEQMLALASAGGQADALADLHSQQQQGQIQDNYVLNSQIGPDYQILAGSPSGSSPDVGHESSKSADYQHQQARANQQHQQQSNAGGRPFGLPTKSSSREPDGMLKPMGNPKTISSPAIDFIAQNAPKGTVSEKLADKLPISNQIPTVFSFASSKDPSVPVKAVNQKKRNVMRQAENLARAVVKSINDKFGTNLGDQSEIPFLLSSIGPLGFAQNVLFDPTLLVSLLNSAEKAYQSDVLPGPAKMAIKPVLNFFRTPNKKRDKANILNIISYLTSGSQLVSGNQPKHRQTFGIEKNSNKKNSR